MRILVSVALLTIAAQIGMAGPRVAIAAYTADGTLDSTFARNGKLVVLFPGAGTDGPVRAALDSQNRIVVASTVDDKVGIVRSLPDGVPDSSFNGTGMLITDFGTGAEISLLEIAVDACDQIRITFQQNDRSRRVARLLPDGSLDPSFGVREHLVSHPYGVTTEGALGAQRWTVRRRDTAGNTTIVSEGLGEANAIQVEEDGTLMVAGMAAAPRYRFSLWRRTAAGDTDPSFGVDGSVTTPIPGTYVSRATSLVMQGQNAIVGGYGYTDPTFARTTFALARYNADGSLDASFHGNGTVVTQMSCRGSSQIDSVLIQNFGTTMRLLAVGQTQQDPCGY